MATAQNMCIRKQYNYHPRPTHGNPAVPPKAGSSEPGQGCKVGADAKHANASFLRCRHDTQDLGAPKASGMRSMVNLRWEMYMMGTPGIFRMRRLRSLSQVATM